MKEILKESVKPHERPSYQAYLATKIEQYLTRSQTIRPIWFQD